METQLDQNQVTDQKYYLQVYKRFPLTLVKGEGSYVWDAQGKRYIDALAGIAVNSVGHCHPKIVEAIKHQAEKLIHISNFFTSPPQAELSKELIKLSGMDRVFIGSSGAEAVETGLKLARKYGSKNGKKGGIISFENCFHGRSIATIAAGKKKYQEGFGPMPSGYQQVPFNDLEAVKSAVSDETAAIILEPVQGEGGIHVAEQNFLEGLRKLCDEKDIALIFDEVQCGVGRTGRFFAWEHYGVKPDILTSAKALGGGVPIGATMCTQKIADAIDFGEHGTTYGGNPLVTAAALANVNVIQNEGLVQRAKDLGEKVMGELSELAAKHEEIKGVRGLGMMIGIELNRPGKPVVMKMLEKGVIANCTADTVIRLVPPLNIDERDMEEVLAVFIESLKETE